MGACVITPDTDPTFAPGGTYLSVGTLHLSTSYASGGDTFTVGQFGFGTILTALQLMQDGTSTSGTFIPQVDRTNLKILAYVPAGSTGTTVLLAQYTGSDLSAVIFRYMAWGV